MNGKNCHKRYEVQQMTKAKILVQLKPSVLDPQGKTVSNSLHALGYVEVADTRISKYIEISFYSDDLTKIETDVREICDKLLANPNTEVYHYELTSERD